MSLAGFLVSDETGEKRGTEEMAQLEAALREVLDTYGFDIASVAPTRDAMRIFLVMGDQATRHVAPWFNNEVQFARIIQEMVANGEPSRECWADLKESTDLTEDELQSLFDRAHIVWEAAKSAL